MRNKIVIYILVSAMAFLCTSCTKKAATAENETSKIRIAEQKSPEAYDSEAEEPALPVPVYKSDGDGIKMSAAEALRSAMKGTRSVLELTKDERLFDLGGSLDIRYAGEVKDMPDTGLARINVLEYSANCGIYPMSGEKWVCFLCVDLNQDGTKEVLLVGNDIRAVLHYAGGEVYLTVMPSGIFPSEVYENGVCTNGEWSAWSLCHDMYYPAKGAMYVDMLAYGDEGRFAESGPDIYEIDNKRVTRDEYYAYVEELTGGLTPLEWHDFTEENIDRYVID